MLPIIPAVQSDDMGNRRYNSAIAIAASTMAILGCDGQGDQRLAGLIEAEVKKADPAIVRMSALTTFVWDRLFIFDPYTSAETIEDELGFSWSRSDMIEMVDQFALLVFVKGKSVVRFVAKSRGAGDFAGAHRKGGFGREDAVFRCSKTSNDWVVCKARDSG